MNYEYFQQDRARVDTAYRGAYHVSVASQGGHPGTCSTLDGLRWGGGAHHPRAHAPSYDIRCGFFNLVNVIF